MRATKPLSSPLREENERRRHPRKGSRALANYTVAEKQYVGYVIDISLGGLCLETRRRHQVGDEIGLSFKLYPKQEPSLNVWGKAVWAIQKDSRRWWIGIRFDGLEPAAEHDVAAYMDD